METRHASVAVIGAGDYIGGAIARRFAREGYPVRDLIGYGTAWYAWYMRRLAERPANVVFALRQLLP